jgi:short-subunit dehydrogenase
MRDRALVTGASSGIGKEFARQLAQRGVDLVLSGRNRAALDALRAEIVSDHGIEAEVILADLSHPDGARVLFNDCDSRGLEITILVNNAGLGMFGESVEQDAARIEGLLMLNVVSLTTLTSLFGSKMKQRGGGYILNVGSMAGNQATPFFASYAASKGYVHQFTAALRRELAPHRVRVTCLKPGFVRTRFDYNALIDNPRYLKFSERGALPPATVAKAGLRGLFRNKGVIVAGAQNRLAAFFGALVPEGAKAAMIETAMKRLTRV